MRRVSDRARARRIRRASTFLVLGLLSAAAAVTVVARLVPGPSWLPVAVAWAESDAEEENEEAPEKGEKEKKDSKGAKKDSKEEKKEETSLESGTTSVTSTPASATSAPSGESASSGSGTTPAAGEGTATVVFSSSGGGSGTSAPPAADDTASPPEIRLAGASAEGGASGGGGVSIESGAANEVPFHVSPPGDVQRVILRIGRREIELKTDAGSEAVYLAVFRTSDLGRVKTFTITADFGSTTASIRGKVEGLSRPRVLGTADERPGVKLLPSLNGLFREVHGREPTRAEWEYWTTRIEAGEKTSVPELFGAIEWQARFGRLR